MGEGGGVDQDEGGAVAARGLYAIHQFVLGVGLQMFQLMPGSGGLCREAKVDLGQGGVAIDLRLAGAEQVQVGAVQDQQLCHSTLQRKGGSLLDAVNTVQFAEVTGDLSDCLKSGNLSQSARWMWERRPAASFSM